MATTSSNEGIPGWIVTPLSVFGWYASNIGVVLLNKYLLSFYGFKFPVLLTFAHMFACSALCWGCAALRAFPTQALSSRSQLLKVSLLAIMFAVTIILGNFSLRYISVSFNQAIGATTPFFTALLSLAIQGKRENMMTYIALIPVVAGIVVTTGFEPSFHLMGFLACMLATAGRALKSVVQAVVLSEPSERLDSMNLLMYMAPIATVFLVPTVMALEPDSMAEAAHMLATKQGFAALLALNCFCAFFANLLNFLVTKHTSALTLQVLGNAKGVVAATVSVLLFRNPVSVMGCIGFGITVSGVVAYSQTKKAGQSRPRPALPLHSQGAALSDGKDGVEPEALEGSHHGRAGDTFGVYTRPTTVYRSPSDD